MSTPEKQKFLTSLDRTVAAFPSHYLAVTQELGQELERTLLREMAPAFGFSLYGSLPVLVHLAREHGLAAAAWQGYQETQALLVRHGVANPLLVMLEKPPLGNRHGRS